MSVVNGKSLSSIEYPVSSIELLNPQSEIDFMLHASFRLARLAGSRSEPSIPNINSDNEMEEKNDHLEPKITRFFSTQRKINRDGKDVKIYDQG